MMLKKKQQPFSEEIFKNIYFDIANLYIYKAYLYL